MSLSGWVNHTLFGQSAREDSALGFHIYVVFWDITWYHINFPFSVPRDCLPFNGDGLIESWNPINPNYDSQLLSALFVNVAPELPFKTEQTNKRKLSNNNQALGEMVFNSHQLNDGESGIRLANLKQNLFVFVEKRNSVESVFFQRKFCYICSAILLSPALQCSIHSLSLTIGEEIQNKKYRWTS